MNRRSLAAALLAASALLATGAAAQMPPELADKVRTMGRVIDPPATGALYAPLQEREPYRGVKVERDLAYGPGERHRLDVFAPEASSGAARPVLVFVHGGGFVAGNKRGPAGSPFYDNIGLWAARQGLVGITITYRLAPQDPWPAGAQDVAAAMQWVSRNVAARGGDPQRIFLAGHSAGAVHVATFIAHPELAGDAPMPAGGILLSGLFDIAALPPSPPVRAYYGDDVSRYGGRSSLTGLVQRPVKLMVETGELDPPDFVAQSEKLNAALCEAGRCPRFLMLPGHSHMSEVYAINTKDVSLTREMLAFIGGPR